MPTSDAVEVMPWNTASSPRFTYAGTCDNEARAVSPAGSLPQNSHHHAEASTGGIVAIAAAFQARRITVNTRVPRMKNGPKPDDETATSPATTPSASRRFGGPS